MAEEMGDQDKTEEPTQHRIDEFREKGQVAVSKEFSSVFVLSVSIGMLGLMMVLIYEELNSFIEWIYTLNLDQAYSKEYFKIFVYKILKTMFICIGPFFIVVFLVGILSQIIQFGLIYAPSILEVKFERISPVNGLKRIFSLRSLTEGIKGFLKFVVVVTIAYIIFSKEVWSFGGFLQSNIIQGFLYGKFLILKMGFAIIAGLFILAILDFSWEKFQYHKKLRQTRQQLKEENREKEGNPEIKQRIRNIQKKMAQGRMMQEVPRAQVIVNNPTHISVAIKYDQKTMVAPTIVAKGTNQIAFKIREIAQRHQIPMVENIELARVLYKTVRIGDRVPRVLYKAVAEVLAFVYRMKKRAMRYYG